MATTEALHVQLDNLQHEMQLLQVENHNLQVMTQEDEPAVLEANTYNKDKRTVPALDGIERGNGLEQEVEQWKTTCDPVIGGSRKERIRPAGTIKSQS